MVPGVISEDCGNSDKNRGVTKAMYRIEGCEDVEIFRNGSVHKFYRLKSVDYFGTSDYFSGRKKEQS